MLVKVAISAALSLEAARPTCRSRLYKHEVRVSNFIKIWKVEVDWLMILQVFAVCCQGRFCRALTL